MTLNKGINGAIERNKTKNKLKLRQTANGAPHFIRAKNYFDVSLLIMVKCSVTQQQNVFQNILRFFRFET